MSKIRSSINFANLGEDIKEARKAMGMSRRRLAEMVNIAPRYLANIENSGSLPSLPIFFELVRVCRLSVERYFYSQIKDQDSPLRKRTLIKFNQCPERYLSIVEATIDGILRLEQKERKA